MTKNTFLKKTGFKYCPRCKSANIKDAVNNMECQDCGYKFFINCAGAVSGIITKNDKILMIRRKHDPGKDLLDLPGGFVDFGETMEEALKRELMEEINLPVSNCQYVGSYANLYLYRDVLYDNLDVFFSVVPKTDAEPIAGDDAAEIIWVHPNDIKYDQMAFISAKQALKKYINTYKKSTKNF